MLTSRQEEYNEAGFLQKALNPGSERRHFSSLFFLFYLTNLADLRGNNSVVVSDSRDNKAQSQRRTRIYAAVCRFRRDSCRS